MTLTALMTEAWLSMFLLFQTGSIPIWVPLSIILLIVLLLWWGLTRNSIPDENAGVTEHDADVEQEETAEPQAGSEETETETADEPPGDVEDEEPAPVAAEDPPSPPEPDDLKIIEGIGPKIAGILADAGISTYAELAAADPEQLNQIVRVDAGIKVANPATWPEQAALAASGDWDGLEELQNRLVAGRHRE